MSCKQHSRQHARFVLCHRFCSLFRQLGNWEGTPAARNASSTLRLEVGQSPICNFQDKIRSAKDTLHGRQGQRMMCAHQCKWWSWGRGWHGRSGRSARRQMPRSAPQPQSSDRGASCAASRASIESPQQLKHCKLLRLTASFLKPLTAILCTVVYDNMITGMG